MSIDTRNVCLFTFFFSIKLIISVVSLIWDACDMEIGWSNVSTNADSRSVGPYPASRGPSIFLDKSGRRRDLCEPPRLSLISRSPTETDESVRLETSFPCFGSVRMCVIKNCWLNTCPQFIVYVREHADMPHNKHTKSFLVARVLDITFFPGVFGEPKISDDSMMESPGFIKLDTLHFFKRTVFRYSPCFPCENLAGKYSCAKINS